MGAEVVGHVSEVAATRSFRRKSIVGGDRRIGVSLPGNKEISRVGRSYTRSIHGKDGFYDDKINSGERIFNRISLPNPKM
jgi:hypothetical protein